ncbi:MAG: AlpA family phage regulatory protein [Woeseiaceae bacterium]
MATNSTQNNTDLSNLPDNAVIRLPDVLRLYPVSKSHWWQGIKDGRYPKPCKLGLRARGWRISDILALTQDQQN